MQLTPYHVTCPHPDDPEQLLLFATKTGALVILPVKVFAGLREGIVAKDALKPLTEMGFLVSDPDQERRAVYGYLAEVNRVNPNLTVALILGMECNFACKYCFQSGQKDRAAMSDATADRLVAFIRKCFKPGKKKLLLQIYGGEPLLYTKRIISLARQLKPFVEGQGAELVIDIVSNGSLLTPQVVDELNQWGLDGIKITIDGPPENHNYFRPFKSGKPSFEVIVRNLSAVRGKTKIRLGGNYTMENYQSFPPVLDLLAAQGVTPDTVELVNFNIVMQMRETAAGNVYRGGCCTVNEPWLQDAALHVREEVFKRGYMIAELGPQPCAVEVEDAFTVHYDGSLYKCVIWAGQKQFKIGDIWQGIDEQYKEIHHLGHWQREEKCRKCVYLPLCFGGCRSMAYQRDGHMANVDCKKEFLDATLKIMLAQDIKYRYGAAASKS
ncbi:MAG: geopeptide radical SAM maturase [Desulfurivibrionaceae bacterium]